jgi:hypothetical protein
VAVEARFLDYGADSGQCLGMLTGHVAAHHPHGSGAGAGEAEQGAYQGGLAGPVGAEKSECDPGRDAEVDAVDGGARSEALGEPVGLDQKIGTE